MQTKTHSFYEALSNTMVGFIISLSATFVIFPLLDIPTSSGQNIVITLFFTVISVIRGYVMRRWFNEKTENKSPTPSYMFCFECEATMLVKETNGKRACAECGLRH